MLLVIIGVIVVGVSLLGLSALPGRLGLVLLFVFVASNQFVETLLATTVYVELLGRYPVSPGSAVLFSSSLFALLLIYLREDIATTRSLIYGILLANSTLVLGALGLRWAIDHGHLEQTVPLSAWLVHFDLGTFLLGTLLLLVDTFLLIILYEVLRSRVTWLPKWLRIMLSLVVVLALDTTFFVGVAFRDEPSMTQMLVGGLMGKSLAGVLYGTLLWAYLRISSDALRREESRETRNPLSILTFGEQYRALERSVEELERLREHERRRSEIALRGARLGAWDWQLQTGETFHDQLWAEMLGYTQEGIASRIDSWRDRIHPDDRARVTSTLNDHLRGKTPFYEAEHRLRTKSGEWKWILSLGMVTEWDAQGKPARMTGTHMDISERKQGEETAILFRRVLESSLSEVYTFDAETLNFVDSNRRGLENLGYSLNELRTLKPVDLKPDFTDETFAELIAPLRAGRQQVLRFTTVHRRKDGTEYPVEVHLDLSTESHSVFIASVLDITDRVRAETELKQLGRRYRELFEGAPLKYVITELRDNALVVTDCNSTFLEVLGYQRDEVIGRPLKDFYTSASASELASELATELASLDDRWSAVGENSFLRERQLVTKSGKVVETLLRAIPELDSDANLIGTRAMYVDITERKRAEAALRKSEATLVEAQRLARIGDWESSLVTNDYRWSNAMYEIFGVNPEEFEPDDASFYECVHPNDRALIKRRVEGMLQDHQSFEVEYRIVRPDGEIRTLHAVVALDFDSHDKPIRMRGTAQDITERKLAEEELRHSTDRLRKLAARIDAILEQERKKMARTIHDELGQALTSLRMDLSWLRQRLDQNMPALGARVDSMISLVDETVDQVRDLSSQLRPSELDDLGLGEAVVCEARQFSDRSGIECIVNAKDPPDSARSPHPDYETTVFRIVQEALTNIARHAGATRVEINLDQVDSVLRLEIIDNGKGIEPEQVWNHDSLGLLGMRERAERHGGTVGIFRAESGGTRVSARIPL